MHRHQNVSLKVLLVRTLKSRRYQSLYALLLIIIILTFGFIQFQSSTSTTNDTEKPEALNGHLEGLKGTTSYQHQLKDNVHDDKEVEPKSIHEVNLKYTGKDDISFEFNYKTVPDYLQKLYDTRNVDWGPHPGQDGKAYKLQGQTAEEIQKHIKREAINLPVADIIPMNRTLPDYRHSECRSINYPTRLPTASVIVIQHNEARSLLLRTVHSVINRTPPKLLYEVIIVDDFSDRAELSNVTEYCKNTWPSGIVTVIRTSERLGLVRARQVGAERSKGDVLIFLDSHCEVTEGWAEPLLYRILTQPNVAVQPEIDSISDRDWTYYGGHSSPKFQYVGGFWWSLHFSWNPQSESAVLGYTSESQVVPSPTMAGGLLAIGRKFYFHLGGYDTGMDIWGGENLEMSFRLWMCGGRLEIHPCSHVGHVFREFHPYTFPGRLGKDTHGINSVRMAEVWMDGFQRYFYWHRRDMKTINYGDLSERHQLRQKLQCKSFRWFLRHVYPSKFILDEDVQGYGNFMNHHESTGYRLCIDSMGHDEKQTFNPGVYNCHDFMAMSQMFSLSMEGQIRLEENCLQLDGTKVKMSNTCMKHSSSQRWIYHNDTQLISSMATTSLCLSTKDLRVGDDLRTDTCDEKDEHQRWRIQNLIKLVKYE